MKQDRNGVRTAQDLERKYDFSSIDTLKRNYELQKTSLNKVENELNNFVEATTQNIEDLQNQVDGNITTWFSSGIPTLNNYPANEWTDNDTKNNHLGDLYYDKNTGYGYRFTLEENTYKWIEIKDTDVTQALALANAAQDTADSKRRVFVVQPTPPYDVGDLWLNNEELYRCQITKGESETYASRDWIKATKYTDDTVANQVGNNLTILSGTVTEIRDDVDELSTTMTNTTTLVNEQGETIGTLQEQQSSTSQTVTEISATVASHGHAIDNLEDTVEEHENQLTPTDTASGSSIYLEDSAETELIDFELEGKTTQESEPSPSNHSDLISVGYANLFDSANFEANLVSGKIRNDSGTIVNDSTSTYSTYMMPVKANKTYTFKGYFQRVYLLNSSGTFVSRVVYNSSNTLPMDTTYTPTIDGYFQFQIRNSAYNENKGQELVYVGTQAHSYIPYGKYGIEVKTIDSENNSNTYLYTLDNPLRSNKDGTIKDRAYIKNNMLFVDRKMGSVDLSTITWNKYGHNVSGYSRYSSTTIPNIKYVSANTQLGNGMAEKYVLDIGRGITSKIDKIAIDTSQVSVVASDSPSGEFIYELANPYTEELGTIQIPSTYKVITYLNTTDELEPNMNITYVRNTIISNYVESHVSELKINEQGITSRVQTIEESDYGSRINAVEERTTDTEKNIEIISTNIDKETGEVREVTTKNGLTFNEKGLNLHTNQNEFNTQITNEATEYRNGDSLINKTSRDGSLLTKLRLQEQTYYSHNGSDTSNPMNTENFDFVDERVEIDGEYCYATFYNGEE